MSNTINWNAPTIKAAKITSRSSGGSSSGGGGNWSGIGQSIAQAGQSIAAGMKLRQQNIRYEKEQQLQLLKTRNAERTIQYDKVAQIKTLPNSEFETSKNTMFYDLMDRYVDIKAAMDDPSSGLDPAVGQKALSEINASVGKFKEFAPKILVAATSLRESLDLPFGSAGAIAGGVPTAQQQLLLNLIEGGNVQIQDREGVFYLYDTDDKGNVKDVFNLDEYMSVTNQGLEPDNYFRQIIDNSEIEKDAASILGTAQAPVSTYYSFDTELSDDGKTEIRNLEWKSKDGVLIGREAAVKNIAASGFNILIDDPKELTAMQDLWNDTIGLDGKGITGQDAVWDPKDETKREYKVKGYIDDGGNFVFDPEGDTSQVYKSALGVTQYTQKEFAKRWLAERSILDNAPKPRIVGQSKNQESTSKGYSYDMYGGYVNNQKKIDAALKADPNADLSEFNGEMLSAGSTGAYRLRASGQTAVWEHVILQDALASDGTTKVKTWKPVDGEKPIPAQGSWSKMKERTKQYRTKN